MLQTDTENTQGFPGLTEAVELGTLLSSFRGGEVVVMDMRELNFWTDFFVIATASGNAQLSGLERHVKEYAQEKGVDIVRRSRKPETEDEWRLLDMGGIVVHLMTAKTRAFYELERLWSAAPVVYSSKSL